MESSSRIPQTITPKEIGYKLAFIAISYGLAIAFVIWVSLAGFSWLTLSEFVVPILLAIIVMYVSGYFWGGIAGKLIIEKRYASGLIGIACGFLVTWSATLAGCLPGFLFGSSRGNIAIGELTFDYIVKPLYWVTAFGFVPILIVGLIYGIAVENRWKKYVKAVKESKQL